MLRSRTLVIMVFGVAAVAVAVAAVFFNRERQTEQRWAMVQRYCTDCHNDIDRAGELTFESLAPEAIARACGSFRNRHQETARTAYAPTRQYAAGAGRN